MLLMVAAIAHLFFEVTPRRYGLSLGVGVPSAVALAAVLDRQLRRPIWLPLLLVTVAVFNANRFGSPWLTPIACAVAAAWLFRESWRLQPESTNKPNRLVRWVAITFALGLLVMYGPEIVMAILGIPVPEQ
jgi:Na+/H+ antiporter NhaD/arsenite permease-like protein